MRERTVRLYYCEFCRKTLQRRHAMARHEAACTNNPARVCRVCDRTAGHAALIEAASIGLLALEQATGGCPACMLFAVRQLNKTNPEAARALPFDYPAHKAAWWARVNAEKDDPKPMHFDL